MSMNQQKILIVDDEPKVAFFFQKYLEMVPEHYLAITVHSGSQAIEELQKQSYDLLITDLRMPQMDGLELVRRARTISPKTKTILMTAYGTDEVWEQANKLDIFRSLSKPLKVTDLLDAVRGALTEKHPAGSGLLILSGEGFEQLTNYLEQLRVDLGARVTVLADMTGRILAYSGSTETLELSTMIALLGGNMAASVELSSRLNYPEINHLSFYEGPPFDLYAATVSPNFFITLVFDRRKDSSRIGFVWLYSRRALSELRQILHQNQQAEPASLFDRDFVDHVQSELDNLLGGTQPTKAESKGLPAGTRPLRQQLEAILHQFSQQTGLKVEHRLESLTVTPPPVISRLILRVVAAGLKNVYQHAHATIVGVTFRQDEHSLIGSIADNGLGAEATRGLHLRSLAQLQQELNKNGGRLEIQSRPGQGTTLTFYLSCD